MSISASASDALQLLLEADVPFVVLTGYDACKPGGAAKIAAAVRLIAGPRLAG